MTKKPLYIDGKRYISAKEAADLSGRNIDYIGQLGRNDKVKSFVSGRTRYVLEDDIRKTFNIGSEEYISAKEAAEVTGYNIDYVGQLGRSGKVDSYVSGRTRFVSKQEILKYKRQTSEIRSVEKIVKPTKVSTDKKESAKPEAEKFSKDSEPKKFHISPYVDSTLFQKSLTLALSAILVFGAYVTAGNVEKIARGVQSENVLNTSVPVALTFGAVKDTLLNSFNNSSIFVYRTINDFLNPEEETQHFVEREETEEEKIVEKPTEPQKIFVQGPTTIVERIIERVPEASVSTITRSELEEKLQKLSDEVFSEIFRLTADFEPFLGGQFPGNQSNTVTTVYRAISQTNKIDNLEKVTISNSNVTGSFTGLTDEHIPDDITASNYLPLVGGSLTGPLTFPYFTATSTTATSSISTGGFTVGTDKLVVQQTSGNVGVGTTSPYAKLSVAGSVAGEYFVATSTTATSTFAGAIGIGTTSPNSKLAIENGSIFQGYGDASSTNIVGTLSLGTSPLSISVKGRYAYVVDNGSDDLKVIDVTDPTAPATVGTLSIGTIPKDVAVSGKYAYIIDSGSDDLKIVDVSNPALPTLAGTLAIGTIPEEVFVSGKYVYVIDDGSADLRVIDVSNPADPFLVGSIAFPDLGVSPFAVYVQGGYAYVVDIGSNDLKIIDVSNPSSMSVAGSVTVGESPADVVVLGRYAYIVDTAETNNFSIVDISNATSPSVAGTLALDANPFELFVSGRYAYVTDVASDDLKVIDVSKPASPTIVDSVPIGTNPRQVVVSGRYAYVVDFGSDDLKIVDVTGIEVVSGIVHSLEAGLLQVRESAYVGNILDIGGGVRIGQEGLLSYGPASFGEGDFVVNTHRNDVGVGTTSPWAKLSVHGLSTDADLTKPLFVIASSTPTATTTAFIVDAGGNVGVGTANPTSALHLPQQNDAATPTFAFGDGDTGFYEAADDVVGLSVGGTVQFALVSNRFAGDISTSPAVLNLATSATAPVLIPNQTFTDTGIGSGADSELSFITSSVEAVRINSSGNVGVASSSPAYTLGITGTLGVTGTARFESAPLLSSILGCNAGQNLETNSSGVVQCGTDDTGGGGGGSGNWVFDEAGAFIRLATTTNKVGVGTSSPYAKLSIDSGGAGTTTLALKPVTSQTANIIDIYNTSGVLTSVLTPDHKLGIGTSSPPFNLSVDSSGTTNTLLTGGTSASLLFEDQDATTGERVVQLLDSGGLFRIRGLNDERSSETVTGISMDLTNGNIGIGTTSPSTILTIDGPSPVISLADNSPAGRIIQFRNGNLDLFDIFDRTASSTLISIASDGNVAIGTTTISEARLYVSGGQNGSSNVDIRSTSSSENSTVEVQSDDYATSFQSAFLQYKGSGVAGNIFGSIPNADLGLIAFQNPSNALIYTSNTSPLIFGTDFAERMRLTATGNLGLGTTSPWAKLSVHGLSTDSDPSQPLFVIATSTPTATTTVFIVDAGGNVGIGTSSPSRALHVFDSDPARIIVETQDTDGRAQIDFINDAQTWRAGVVNADDFIIGDITAGQTSVFTIEPGAGNSTLYLNSSGNVGIGTTSPDAPLDIYSSTSGASTRVLNITGIDSAVPGIFLDNQDAGIAWASDVSDGGDFRISIDGSGIQEFVVDPSGAVGIAEAAPVFGIEIATTTASGYLGITNSTDGDILTVDSSGNVGIGTSSPQKKLHVSSGFVNVPNAESELVIEDDGANTYVSVLAPSSAQAGILFGDDTNPQVGKVLYDHSDNSLRLETSATEAMRIDQNGNIGIGTTTPQQILSVVGNTAPFLTRTFSSDGSTSRTVLNLARLYSGGAGSDGIGAHIDLYAETETEGDEDPIAQIAAITTDATQGTVDSDIYLRPYLDGSIVSNAFVIKSSGNVGIGTSSPDAQLHVSGTGVIQSIMESTDNDAVQLRLKTDSVNRRVVALGSDGITESQIILGDNGKFEFGNQLSTQIPFTIDAGAPDDSLWLDDTWNLGIGTTTPWAKLSVTNTGTAPSFVVEDSTSPDSTPFIVDSSGNVGIGTTSPVAKLAILANATGNKYNPSLPGLTLEGGDAYILDDNLGSAALYIGDEFNPRDAGFFYDFADDELRIRVDNADYITIDGGNTGIDDSSPIEAKLVVGGDLFVLTNTAVGNDPLCWDGGGGSIHADCTSLRQYKTNIENFPFGLEKLTQLRPRTFDWLNGRLDDSGFIAEEVEQVDPLLATHREGELRGVSSNAMIALLVKSLQELVQQVGERFVGIESRLTTLEVGSGTTTAFVIDNSSIIKITMDHLASLGAVFERGLVRLTELVVDTASAEVLYVKEKVVVGTPESPQGITLFDPDGNPYCVSVAVGGGIVSASGECGLALSNGSPVPPSGLGSSTEDNEPPTIVLNGNNPAVIEVGATYSDLGVVVTDNVNDNLGYSVSVDGVETSVVEIDTGTSSTHTILYTATDEAGNVSEATRTVIVGDGGIDVPAEEESSTATSTTTFLDNATSTPPVIEEAITEDTAATSTPDSATSTPFEVAMNP